MGRPSEYSQDIAVAVCERLSDGESLRQICEDEGMPNRATIFRWLGKHPEFSDQYARAREEQADCLADEIVSIADDEGIAADSRRVRIDARKWVAGKLRPKKYSDKLQVGGDPDGAPIAQSLTVHLVKPNG